MAEHAIRITAGEESPKAVVENRDRSSAR